MDRLGQWQRYKAWLFDDRDLGFRLDVSRMDLAPDAPQRMQPRLDAALRAMQDLEKGALANPDEGRRVGHYWLRAPELAPDPADGEAIRGTLDAIVEFARRIHGGELRPVDAQRFDQLLLIGIGGSALGPQFVARALGGSDDRMVPHFIDNTDPDGIDAVLEAIGPGLARTLAVVISKSGGTPETRNGMLEAQAAFAARGLQFGHHAVAITQEGSRLDRHAIEHGFLGRFPMWDWIGGRTSETSVVGLLPAALQGLDIRALLSGAARMDRRTRDAELLRNPAALLALSWFEAGAGRGDRSMVILPYKDRLDLLARYLQQLVMESVGKALDLSGDLVHQGLAVYGNKGSTDQHAYVQQLRDGRADFFATFVDVLRERERPGIAVEDEVTCGDYLHGFLLGTRQALHENGRPSITITIDAIDASRVGMLIALYERAVGLYASLIDVNAYHQPGVEAGKRAAADVLGIQRKLMTALGEQETDGAGAEHLAASIGEEEQVETVFLILERLAANPRRGVGRRSGATPFDATYFLA